MVVAVIIMPNQHILKHWTRRDTQGHILTYMKLVGFGSYEVMVVVEVVSKVL